MLSIHLFNFQPTKKYRLDFATTFNGAENTFTSIKTDAQSDLKSSKGSAAWTGQAKFIFLSLYV
jgi:hypothetical protein